MVNVQNKIKPDLIMTLANIFIASEIDLWPFKWSADFTLGNSLLRAVKLTKNADFDKYKYSGYVVGFDPRGSFLLKKE